MSDGEFFFIGQDLVKDPTTILRAYSQPNYPTKGSPQGIRNIHQQLQGSLVPSDFYPYLTYDPLTTSIRDFMVSKRRQVFKIRDREFLLEENEPIEVFSSRKSSVENLSALMAKFGLKMVNHFEDSKGYFTNIIFQMDRSIIPANNQTQ